MLSGSTKENVTNLQYVVDDEEYSAVKCRRIIDSIGIKDLQVDIFIDSKHFCDVIFNHKEPFDIIILDIDMPNITGLELAKELRNNNENVIIIFLTNHDEFVFQAFEFQPFRYIRKMKINTEMPLAISSVVKILELRKDYEIMINCDGEEHVVLMSEIVYIEAEKRKTNIHLNNKKILLSNINLSRIANSIQNEKFLSIHRGCLVNIDYIKTIKNDIILLKNNEELLISRRRLKDVKQQIMKLWGDTI